MRGATTSGMYRSSPFEPSISNSQRPISQVRDELNHEALQFVKEQRIRCLLAGSWFPHTLGYRDESGPVTKNTLNRMVPSSWRYVRLSHNRRYLHYADFENKLEQDPRLDQLQNQSKPLLYGPSLVSAELINPLSVDLTIVSSVVSNVSASTPSTASSASTLRTLPASTSTKITIFGYPNEKSHGSGTSSSQHPSTSHSSRSNPSSTKDGAIKDIASAASTKESVLLTLHPQSHTLASEWLDGLLMLLNQQPITADTNKLVQLVGGYGLKIRLLNVRFEELDSGEPELPTREGLDEDYWYDIGGLEGSVE